MLQADTITCSYDGRAVVHDLSLTIQSGEITTIIGPNGCGKSTLLRALIRLLTPDRGAVLLDGQLIHRLPTRALAQRMGLLAQRSTAIDVTVEELALRGRYPHQGFFHQPTSRDRDAVEHALRVTGMTSLRHRSLDTLSGGQRQRAWMAMAVAQETPILLLDEPTTYLDLAHQLEITDLVRRLNRDEGRTIVMVLHDINEAIRTSHHIVAMKDGRIVRTGPTEDVIDQQLLFDLYGVDCDLYTLLDDHRPLFVPRGQPPTPLRSAPARQPVEEKGFQVNQLKFGYDTSVVLRDVTVDIPAGAVTMIVGPNACGKSTLLQTCGRLLCPAAGCVLWDRCDVRKGSHRALARKIAHLAQEPVPPAGVVVEDLVASGRLPHQGVFHQWREQDESAVDQALARLDISDLRVRPVDELSGGQRQRAWMAMTLAQTTPVLLLDEPTTFLDISAQLALLDLVRTLNREDRRTIVMVLHDLNLAARYADHMVVMSEGKAVASGPPREVLTKRLLRDVFDVEATIRSDPRTGAPLVVPNRVSASSVKPADTPGQPQFDPEEIVITDSDTATALSYAHAAP